MNDLQRLRATAGEFIAQLLAMFPPEDCAALLRHMVSEIEQGQEIARRWQRDGIGPRDH